MREFRIPTKDRPSDPRVRILLWEGAFLLFGMTLMVYSAMNPGIEFRKPLFFFSLAIIAGALLVFNFYGLRAGFNRVKYDLSFVLTDGDLIRKRTGWPDIQIKLSEITALYERPGWLTIRSNDPQRRIGVPQQVEGYDVLRAELAKHARLGEGIQRPHARLSLAGWALILANILVYWLLFGSHNMTVIRTAGAGAVLLLAWSSFYLHRSLGSGPRRWPLLIFLAAGWVAALALIFSRLFT